ncbi:MAG: hypothetical protein LBM65_05395 [Oscillospiraceae bacterium]|jgi:uncharacterized membrane protein (DUF106 family)|nr:hypothetical protein [Oscillospiraceae bacterium]
MKNDENFKKAKVMFAADVILLIVFEIAFLFVLAYIAATVYQMVQGQQLAIVIVTAAVLLGLFSAFITITVAKYLRSNFLEINLADIEQKQINKLIKEGHADEE